MPALKTFISSVRRGLEEERDAVPALISAIGHIPRRFEDFTAQAAPSREACLAGVEDADVYLLLLGAHYGDPLPDSGLSPTEEEWMVAKRRGIPILVFRQSEVEFDPEQAAFVRRVEDYVTGRFRNTFTGAADLLPKVASALRELDHAPTALAWTPLDAPLVPEWVITERELRYVGVGATLEVHLLPVGGGVRLPAQTLERLPERLAQLGRDHLLFGAGDPLELAYSEAGARASRGSARGQQAAGTQRPATGQFPRGRNCRATRWERFSTELTSRCGSLVCSDAPPSWRLLRAIS